MPTSLPPRRVLLKLSGEALAEEGQQGIHAGQLSTIAKDIVAAAKAGIEVGVVVGGGNFIRGCQNTANNIQRVTADHMGMLATLLNGLALRDAIEAEGYHATVLSALPVPGIVEGYSARRAIAELASKKVVIFTGGTGNPFVTTDSASSLRSIEINAEVLLKATKVDGIYNADPRRNPEAKRYDFVSYTEALQKELAVMDLAAFCQCRDYNVKIRVFNLFKPGALLRALTGAEEGTLVAATP
jgi:uridylate kinase